MAGISSKNYILYLVLVFFIPCFSNAEIGIEKVEEGFDVKGSPRVVHFNKSDYKGDLQFWCMAEDESGILYFGNNDGVVIYDGSSWCVVKLPNGSTVRSLLYSSDGKLYVGGVKEIGRLEQDEFGTYKYVSLNNYLRVEDRDFGDVWQIIEVEDQIVFRTFGLIIALSGKKTVTLPASQRFGRISVIEDRLYVVDDWGLKRLTLATFEFENIVPASTYEGHEVSGVLPGRKAGEIMLFTKPGNSYFVNPEKKTISFFKNHLPNFSSDQIFCALKSSKDTYYLGTINSYLLSFEFDGFQLEGSTMISGMQDKTVLGLDETNDGNIWAMLNKGIDCIEIASPVSVLFEGATVLDVRSFKDSLYLATNQGVYMTRLSKDSPIISTSDFKIVDGLEAQAWSLGKYEEKLIVSHDKGVFVLGEKGYYHVEGTNGIWKVIPFKGQEHLYLASAYDGIYILEYTEEEKFVIRNKVEGFEVSSRDIIQLGTSNVFWICESYSGVYKIRIDKELRRISSLEHFTTKNGLPSTFGVNAFPYKGNILFLSRKGIYTFDENTQQFVLYTKLADILDKRAYLRQIFSDNDTTWIADDELGVGYFDEKSGDAVESDLFASLRGSYSKSMELIVPLGNQKVLVGTTDGLYLFDLAVSPPTLEESMVFTQVSYRNEDDSLVYCPLASSKSAPYKFPQQTSSLVFQFASPGLAGNSEKQFSVKLGLADENWSEWSSAPSKEYSHLKAGFYAFKVKSRSIFGGETEEAVYYFEILPEWYQTKGAMGAFVLLVLVGIGLSVILVKRKLKITRKEERERRRLVELELQQMKLEKENELITKDKKQLEEVVINKSKELANYTVLLVGKRELLASMNEELKELKALAKNEKTREKIRLLAKKINTNLQDEKYLHVFDTNFERVHKAFFDDLKATYPSLTQKELRLCGFVKMNLTNKEIAAILNISVRGVETARYRLRKRLDLDHEVNMVEFLEQFSSSGLHEKSNEQE
ncbi:helix-turn-helix transcriptional regulator [Flammeovirgaceae bacterium SG7u.111]|nr:helix-turn-helix transcriptional regulator [Flammeovirgaceae bacterium SG7u.132]WPO33523.1 helix-turn-helix transcriptional regulator [Flammeovirgaceae bacterium SG7u.111]